MAEITYYIDPVDGSDLNSGLSPQQAVKSLRKFSGPPLDAGESHPDKSPLPWAASHAQILIKRGTVLQEIAPWNRSGISASQKLTIGAWGSGPRPRIWGIFAQANFINFVEVRDLEIASDTKYQNAGVEWRASGDGCSIVNCRIHGHQSGVNIQTLDDASIDTIRNFLLKDCKIWDNKTGGTPHCQGLFFKGVYNLIVDNCVIVQTGNIGDTFDHGIYGHGYSISSTIKNCIISTDANVGIQCRGGNFEIINNLVLKCAFGITFGSGTNKKQCQGNIKRNVVLYGRDLGQDPISCGIGVSMNSNATEVSENIVAYKKGSSAQSNFGGIGYGNTEAVEYTSLINPNVRQRKSGEISVHDNFVIDWAPALVFSEKSNGGFTANYYLVKPDEVMLKLINSRQWSVDAGQRQFILPEQMADMSALNTYWSTSGKWKIRFEGWDHQPILIDQAKIGIMDQGATDSVDTFQSMPDVTIERYLKEIAGLPAVEQTYDRFVEEILKDVDVAGWASANAFNAWARSQVGL